MWWTRDDDQSLGCSPRKVTDIPDVGISLDGKSQQYIVVMG